jgi:A/G-specific adenine glycosylase
MPVESPLPATALRRALLRWYDRDRRDLPWRATRDPYRIWLSEVLLQQTRVAAATPYYHSFLERFPSLAALARAPMPRVLAAWSGLGYYRRARQLHEAARLVVREHAGRVPDDPARFAALPGVGPYTSGAVLSIAFGRPLAAVDGNVARVLSRLGALPLTLRDARGTRGLWALATSLVPMRRPGDWNQALMELGARLCTPGTPDCPRCPLRAWCRAHALGLECDFPPPRRRRVGERLRQALALIVRRGRILMVRRAGPLMAGLWEPPTVDLAAGAPAGPALRALLRRLGVRAWLAPAGRSLRTTVTHRAIAAEVWWGGCLGRAAGGARRASGAPGSAGRRARGSAAGARSAKPRWVDPAAPSVALTALARKAGRLAASGWAGAKAAATEAKRPVARAHRARDPLPAVRRRARL